MHWLRIGLLTASVLTTAALLAWPVREFFLRGQTDFVQLYAGAQLAGSGRLYDPEENYAWHRRLFGVHLPAVLHTRPPFYSLLLKPLAWLPYRTAWWLFVGLNSAAAFWVLRRVLGPRPPSAALALLNPAAWLAILWGQDVWLAAACCGGAALLLERGRDFRAGLLFSLCALKPHLFVLVPVALAIHRKWRVLAGGAAGGAVLVLLSFLSGGSRWPQAYLRLLANPSIHRDQGGMPNLQGVCQLAGCPAWLLAVFSVAVVALAAWASSRSRSLTAALAAALAGSFLISYHAYTHDAVTLLLAFALLPPAALRGIRTAGWFVLASPLPAWLALLGPPCNAALPFSATVALVASVWTGRRSCSAFEPAATLSTP